MLETDPEWRKSSYSDKEGACVEVALWGGETLVRDSKAPTLPGHSYPAPAWRAFLRHLR
ncbi:DUF397 domain-containing protein [Amycolatopsis rhabdoformis]|uniref:DUF397 domain-containing protein n=1 Tax=Amycolatopsis rhabdoformis TaxID=1448059 RepID=A0ABZ1I1V6_9PSEU|nr:DUF397 domain-containing protein [Amycolatopsis rhabdoformis]WSE28134.1 DUF397 domain-containing protein [Amycolatopsis rhabdoformis]